MSKTLKAVCILFAVFNMLACKKFLDEKSNKSLVSMESLNDFQGLLDDKNIMTQKTPGFGQTSDDDFFVTLNSYNSMGDIDKKAYMLNLRKYNFPNDWAYCYNAIYNANYCISKIPLVKRTNQNSDQWDNVMGSALFYRGYYYLNLVWEYGKAYDENTSDADLGIVLRDGIDFNIPSVRSSVKQTYNQVITDLKDAAKYLPDLPIHPLRPSKAASYGALARTYLSMRIYDSAYKYANLALSIKSDLLDYNSSDVSPSNNVPFKPFNPEILFYTTQSGNFTAKYSFYALSDSLLYSSYENNDLRKAAFYYSNGQYYSFKGGYGSDMYIFFSGIATDELYLTRSEANIRLGNLQNGMNDLNFLLQKRYVSGTFDPINVTNEQEALNIVLRERRKELTMRGLRWIDIKRLNKEGRNIVIKKVAGTDSTVLAPNDNRYALPIPQDVIDNSGIQQN